jgi:hypothetical protein
MGCPWPCTQLASMAATEPETCELDTQTNLQDSNTPSPSSFAQVMKTTRLSCALSVASSRTAGTSSTWQSIATILIVLLQSSIEGATRCCTPLCSPRPSLFLVQQLCEGCNLFVLLLQLFCGENRPISLNVLLLSKVCSHASNAFMTNFAFMGDCEQAAERLQFVFQSFKLVSRNLTRCSRSSCRTHLTSTTGESSRLPHESVTYVLSPHNRSRLWREALCRDVRVITAQSQQAVERSIVPTLGTRVPSQRAAQSSS